MPDPYVGITGFMSDDEIAALYNAVMTRYITNNLLENFRFMAGVLVSSKTIEGQPNSLPNKFPKRENLARIFIRDPHHRLFQCLHFATHRPDKLYDHLMMCADYAGEDLDGFQLNIPWPDSRAINRIKSHFPNLKFILQISPHLPEFSEYHFRDLAYELITKYADCADYFLVDFSRGFGQELPPAKVYQHLIELKLAIQARKKNIGLAVAGGLQADNTERLLGALLNDFPGLSWDAEGKLRDDAPGGGNLILSKAETYLKKSFELLQARRLA